MAEKIIRLFILRADQQLWDGPSVRLQVTALSKGLKVLYNESLAAGLNAIQVNLKDLLFDAGQVYGIHIEAGKHRSAWQLINHRSFIREEGGTKVEVKDIMMRLMLVPNKPVSSNLNEGYKRLVDAGSPMVKSGTGLAEADYLALGPAEKMAFLNIHAKLRNTRLNGVPLLSFVEKVGYVSDDRLFLYMRAEAKKLVDDSPDFASAPGHGIPDIPIKFPAHPDSWKHTLFGAGNLQISFSKAAGPLSKESPTQVFSVDADVDLERGLAHVAEWLDNKVHSSKNTDQTLVYALLFSQGIIPYYTLDPIPNDGEKKKRNN
jgi:hypothetical protein